MTQLKRYEEVLATLLREKGGARPVRCISGVDHTAKCLVGDKPRGKTAQERCNNNNQPLASRVHSYEFGEQRLAGGSGGMAVNYFWILDL